LIITNEWESLGDETRNSLVAKLNSLYKQVCQYFSRWELKKILAAAAIFIGIPLVSHAQSFAPPQMNPFGLNPDTVYVSKPVFADIDNDADLDLFTGVYNYGSSAYIQFYKNTGSPDVPIFDPAVQNPFGIVLPFGMVAFPAFADLDNDEDQDLLTGVTIEDNYFPQFLYYENTGSAAEPSFAAAVINPFGLTGGFGFAIPEFVDIDNDGDLDLFSGEYGGNVKFYENTGSATEPDFAASQQNPFGITPAYNIASPAFSDIDHDGDFDLFLGEYYGNFQYFRNSGTVEVPSFAPPIENPFGLVPTYYFNFPAIADLDDDGDDDIIVGEYYGMFQYFKNTEINIGIGENQAEADFELYPNPATDGVFISFSDEFEGGTADLSVVDLNGRIVKSSILNSNDQELMTNDLKPGIYFVRIIRGDKIFTRKLMIR
jgi:hypothetical protein